IPTALRAVLTDFLDGGGRRVRDFYADRDPLLVPLPPQAFHNINTPEDLAALLQKQDDPDR
ncbi:MAG: molybdenum cofactor guanylyltransferase MobA, partial [Armatimonadetes bacterium]|nr:molybdenum cofactor guanylyltransferase MobA [Armatimonadota bacterium]